MMKKIEDFGEKIGGARKDWHVNLSVDRLKEMNLDEKIKYTTRDSVWPLANAKKLVEDGADPFVVYWQRKVRRMINSKPVVNEQNADEIFETFIKVVTDIKEQVVKVSSELEMYDFYIWAEKYREENGSVRFVSWRGIARMKWSHAVIKNYVLTTKFPFGDANAPKPKRKPRKKAFVPPQLDKIEREGKDYRHGINVSPEIWQDDYDFRGVEFGNWLTQKDRQFSMNYAYDALKDLAICLGIEDSDIAFNGRLALAFGARGTSRASAHYEPLRRVINLTKMHGAGCTAHEWMHALDHYIGQKCNCMGFASELNRSADLPQSFIDLVKALKTDANGTKTNFLISSEKFGRQFATEAHGGWTSNVEMLARAFACYVKDTIGCKSDYLIAHADSYVFEFEDESEVCAIPQGEEREIFNELFDKVFYDLKKIGVLNQRKVKVKKTAFSPEPSPAVAAAERVRSVNIRQEKNGQLVLAMI